MTETNAKRIRERDLVREIVPDAKCEKRRNVFGWTCQVISQGRVLGNGGNAAAAWRRALRRYQRGEWK